MALKLGGKPFDLNPLTPNAQKLKAFLDKAPADELFTCADLAKKSSIREIDGQANKYTSRPAFANYWHRLGSRLLWGNPRAIAELRKQVAA